jgi:hypothetical protein
MPNILAHCGVQGALTHALIKDAPPAWIAAEVSIFSLVGETIRVQGQPQDHAAKISIKGKFLDAERIRIENIHLHWPWFRDF